MTEQPAPDPLEHGDYDTEFDVPTDAEPDFDAEESDETDDVVEPIPDQDLPDAATEEDPS